MYCNIYLLLEKILYESIHFVEWNKFALQVMEKKWNFNFEPNVSLIKVKLSGYSTWDVSLFLKKYLSKERR